MELQINDAAVSGEKDKLVDVMWEARGYEKMVLGQDLNYRPFGVSLDELPGVCCLTPGASN